MHSKQYALVLTNLTNLFMPYTTAIQFLQNHLHLLIISLWLFSIAVILAVCWRRPTPYEKLTKKEIRRAIDRKIMDEIDYGIKWHSIPKDKVDAHFQNNPMPTFDPLTGVDAEKSIEAQRKSMGVKP